MKSLLSVFIGCFLIGFCVHDLQAQIDRSVVSSAGNVHRLGLQHHSFTIGEPFIEYLQEDDASKACSQGFHQPIFQTSTGWSEELNMIQFSLYPNPTSEAVVLHFDEASLNTFYLRLTDLAGRTLLEEHCTPSSVDQSLSLKNYPAGSYWLFVLDEKKHVRASQMIEKI